MKRVLASLLAAVFLVACSPAQSPQLPVEPLPPPRTEPVPPPDQSAREPFPGKVAYVSKGEVWVREESAQAQQITQRGPNRLPAWSPDGRWLAFATPTGFGLWQNGAAPQTFTLDLTARGEKFDRVTQIRWSPDSQHLALLVTPAQGGDGAVWLHTVQEAKGQLRLITEGPATDLVWRPDAKALTIAMVDRQKQIARMVDQPVDGGEVTTLLQLTSTLEAGYYRLASWSPDGRYLAFYQMPSSASIAADGVGLYLLVRGTTEPTLLGTALAYPEWIAWSPDGKRLAYVEGSGREVSRGKQVAIWTAEGTKRVEGESLIDPAWAPDGSVLWLAKGGPGLPRRLWAFTPTGEPTGRRCPEGEGNPARQDLRPIPTADGGLLMIWLMEGAASMRFAPADCLKTTGVVSGFDLPAEYYGHYPWAEVIDYHP